MPPLPTPVTVTDMLLVAVHTELVELRADLKAVRGGERIPADQAGQVPVSEPAARRRPKPVQG